MDLTHNAEGQPLTAQLLDYVVTVLRLQADTKRVKIRWPGAQESAYIATGSGVVEGELVNGARAFRDESLRSSEVVIECGGKSAKIFNLAAHLSKEGNGNFLE